MALPLQSNTQIFSADQTINFRAQYFDTANTAIRLGPAHPTPDQYTAFGSGVAFAMFDLLDKTFAPVDRASLESALTNPSTKTRPTLGYDRLGNYRTGVVPNVYMYWGSGAPAGGSRAKSVLLKFSGTVQASGTVTLVLAGQGTVQVYANKANTPILAGKIRAPEPLVTLTGVTPARITGEWGYQFITTTFTKGDIVEIYYWHNGEPWGGICAKAFPGTIDTSSDAFLANVRSAAVIGASFMAKESAPIPAMTIPYIAETQIKTTAGAVTEMQMKVALTTKNEGNGFFLDTIRDENRLVDNANTGNAIKKGRIVHFEGGFLRPDGTDELYPRFTGYIEDILPDSTNGVATIVCKSFEGLLAGPFDENNPDFLSYHANGYILRQRVDEPVYGITAFDYWPVEVAVRDLMYRAGIDAYNMGLSPFTTNPNFGSFRYSTATTGTTVYGAPLVAARLLATSTNPILIERNANYGNVPPLNKDALPTDDAYLFVPDVQQRLFDRLKTITDHYGYDFFFNGEGRAVLTGRNNPIAFQYATRNGAYTSGINEAQYNVNINAVGGVYLQKQHSIDGVTWSRVIEGTFSRVDLYCGLGIPKNSTLNGGLLNVKVEVSDGAGGFTVVQQQQFTTFYNGPEGFYYTGLVRSDGTNAAVLKIVSMPFDHYRVTVTGAGPDQGQTDCLYRINGAAIYERDPEQSFYSNGAKQQVFTTLGNTLNITPESNYKDLRNAVIVVGSRLATVTDSSKLNNLTTNPNNPEYEFNVAVAVDPFSIYDPTSPNYVGMKRMVVVFDSKVNDGEFARWLTRTVLFQYRMPKTSATFTHTALPVLDIRDAMFVVEERNRSVEHLLYVTGYTERWAPGSATTDIQSVATPQIPSFQPREDIDIDTLFRADPSDPHSGVPLINVNVSYQNVYGVVVSNAQLSDTATIKSYASKALGQPQPMASVPVTSGTSMVLSQSAIPETFYLSQNVGPTSLSLGGGQVVNGVQVGVKRALVNNPYRHFFHFLSWDSTRRPTVGFAFEEGDGTTGVYDQSYYQFPSGGLPWYANYDYLTTRLDASSQQTTSPFYDPYSSEVGNLINLSFDLLVSGRIRVVVFDANQQSVGFPVPVAYLTNPEGDPNVEDAHWNYFDAGTVSFSWDAVDNIGFWNVIQSQNWADELQGSFGDKPVAVGRGYYAWNDVTTNPHTFIGDASAANFDASNAPYFTIGQFGQFMFRIEVLNDRLARKDLETTGHTDPRTVWTDTLAKPGVWNPTAEVYAWTHLGEPNQVAIRIQDYVSSTPWDRNTNSNDSLWSPSYSTPDADATIKLGKPVRMTFVPRARHSPFFEDASRVPNPKLLSVKMTRQVHLKATVFDQFWTLYGKTWQDFHAKYDIGGTEAKRVTSRMYHDEDHTLEWEDGAWRTGENLQFFEWVFDPSLFQKDFGRGTTEKLRYGDYEQLESLPGFNVKNLGGTSVGTRSYMLMAFINYLFYFSAFVMDRSGRRQWCLNNWTDGQGTHGFVDKSKIVSPNWLSYSGSPTALHYQKYALVDYEQRGADRFLARTVFVRQWKEPTWATGTYVGSPVTAYGISGVGLNFVQPRLKDFAPEAGVLIGDTTDRWLTEYNTPYSPAESDITRLDPQFAHAPLIDGISNYTLALSQFSASWDFNRPGVTNVFTPSPARDFHPYWIYPLMPDWAVRSTMAYTGNRYANAVNVLQSTSSNIHFGLRDPAAQHTWYGYAWADSFATPGSNYIGARVEQTVEELGAIDPDSLPLNKLTYNQIANLFDYQRQDQLDRFDQYRGVISRAPYPDRKTNGEDAWDGTDKKRASSSAPVKPSGMYVINLARYSDYTLAPVHKLLPKTRIHFMDSVSAWYDVRFAHEFVWYSARYFPITQTGGAVYMYTHDEYTRVSEHVGAPWWATWFAPQIFDPKNLDYDAGAWIGHKWDIPSSSWAADSHLRWREVGGVTHATVLSGANEHLSGGYGSAFAGVGGTGTARANWGTQPLYDEGAFAGQTPLFRRVNFFDEQESILSAPRLAVGPEVPESRGLIMNLVLPKRLKGS